MQGLCARPSCNPRSSVGCKHACVVVLCQEGLSQQWHVQVLSVFLTGIVRHHVQGAEEEEQAPEEAATVVVEDTILLSDQELLQIIKVSISTMPTCSEHIYQFGS